MATNRSIQADNDNETTLLTPPAEMREEIYSRCLPRTLGLFALTSRQIQQESVFVQLLSNTVNAEPESYQQEDATQLKMIATLKENSDFLFMPGMVTNQNNNQIFASPYRLLLGTGDIWGQKQVHEEILPNMVNGVARAEAQFREQFPDCPWPLDPTMGEEALYDERNKEQIRQVIAQLQIIKEKITADPCTNGEATLLETTKAVEELCQIFAPKEGEVIRTGLHFPQGIMREIYKVYDAQFSRWSVDRLSFFSRTVIAEAIAASTAVDGQCYKHGLIKFDTTKGPDRRDGIFCRYPKGIPQELTPINDKLGRTMLVDPYIGYSCVRSEDGVFVWYNKSGVVGRRDARHCVTGVCCWTSHEKQKQRHMEAIMRPRKKKSTPALDDDHQSKRMIF